jgi:hypothetical protein
MDGPSAGGVVHFPGSSAVTVAEAGDYLITYTVTTTAVGLASDVYAVIVNGATQFSTIYGNISTGGGDHMTIGSAIVALPAGATVSLRNMGTRAHSLANTVDGIPVINGSIRLIRLG